MIRHLDMCANARVKGGKIYCSKGHKLARNWGKKGDVNISKLAKGNPLIYSICQKCQDYDEMGPALKPKDRGWLACQPACHSLGETAGRSPVGTASRLN